MTTGAIMPRPLLRRLGAARADRHDRHQPPRRLSRSPTPIAADLPRRRSGKAGRAGLDALLAARGVDVVTFRDWQKIEAAEAARARDGAPREKFVDVADMLAARG